MVKALDTRDDVKVPKGIQKRFSQVSIPGSYQMPDSARAILGAPWLKPLCYMKQNPCQTQLPAKIGDYQHGRGILMGGWTTVKPIRTSARTGEQP